MSFELCIVIMFVKIPISTSDLRDNGANKWLPVPTFLFSLLMEDIYNTHFRRKDGRKMKISASTNKDKKSIWQKCNLYYLSMNNLQ